jgi:hypothetical protein
MSLIVRATRKRQYDPDANSGLGGVVSLDGVSPAVVDIFPSDILEGVHIAGEDLEAGMPVYKKAADDKLYKSQATDGTAEKDNIVGWTVSRCPAGQAAAISVAPNFSFGYSDGTAPKHGKVYLSTTAGNIADATAYTGQKPCGYSFDGYVIRAFAFVFAN